MLLLKLIILGTNYLSSELDNSIQGLVFISINQTVKLESIIKS
jgi:hypothetical protein